MKDVDEPATMTKDEILATLKKAEPQLRARGVKRAALFGSQARGEAHGIDYNLEKRGDSTFSS